MYSTRTATSCRALASKQSAAQVLKALNSLTAATSPRPAFILIQHHGLLDGARYFSSTPASQIKEFFPVLNQTENIKKTEAAWPHPIYTEKQMNEVKVAHRQVRDWSDRVALGFVRVLRWGLDLASGYKHEKEVVSGNKDSAKTKFVMNEEKYLIRNIFLESVAGVPGMVAGMLRHLHSMRRMKRDNGWIETLLEESYNERMHLLTFLKMAEPGWFMRLMVLGAQGVFFNAFFVSYLISPRTAHRFVGHLEEEAVYTYSLELSDLDAGRLPKWEKLQAPDIAIDYWKMPEGHRTMRDLLLYIRADEAKHREVNHTFANLDQKNDPNPYVSTYQDSAKPHPTKGIEYLQSSGWERKDII